MSQHNTLIIRAALSRRKLLATARATVIRRKDVSYFGDVDAGRAGFNEQRPFAIGILTVTSRGCKKA